MQVFHFIPTGEIEIHEVGEDCMCEPVLIDSYILEGCEWEGEVVYEHIQMLPKEMQVRDEEQTVLYNVIVPAM